jgi:hypothetical protein
MEANILLHSIQHTNSIHSWLNNTPTTKAKNTSNTGKTKKKEDIAPRGW